MWNLALIPQRSPAGMTNAGYRLKAATWEAAPEVDQHTAPFLAAL